MTSYTNSAFIDDGRISRSSFYNARKDSVSSLLPPVDTVTLSMFSLSDSVSTQETLKQSPVAPILSVTSSLEVPSSTYPKLRNLSREDGSKETLLDKETKVTEQELPHISPLPRAARKFFWSIFLIGGSFLLALQLGTVGVTFLNSKVDYIRSSSQSDVDMPSITLCTETKDHLEAAFQDILNSLLNPDGINFDTKLVQLDSDMEELYKNNIVYPRKYLQNCMIDGYSCLEESGDHHNWTNILNQVEACSTLKLSMKVQHDRHMKTELTIESDIIQKGQQLNLYVHDAKLSLPTYHGKEFLHVGRLTKTDEGAGNLELTMAAEELILSNGNGDETCNADENYDRNKEQDICIDEQLVKLPTNCSFPWMRVPYQSCTSPRAAINISNALQSMTTDDCNLPWPCKQWIYTKLHENITIEDGATMRIAVEVDAEVVTTSVKEDVEWPKTNISSSNISSKLFEFIALIGASVAFFFNLSVLGLLDRIIDTAFPKRKPSSPTTCVPLRLLVFVLCWAALIFQVCGLAYYFSYQTTVVQENDGNLLHHKPISVTVCTDELNSTFSDLYLDTDTVFPEAYWTLMFISPLSVVEMCTISGKFCENHTNIEITSNYYPDKRCETIKRKGKPIRRTSPAVMMISSSGNISVSVHPANRFLYEWDDRIKITENKSISVDVKITDEKKVSECSNDYIECLEACFQEKFIKKTPVCSMPGKQTKDLPACTSSGYYYSSLAIYKELLQDFDQTTCNCKPACCSETYDLSFSTEETVENKRDVHINLTPTQVTKRREMYAYPTLELMLHIGGCLALITGTSLLCAFTKLANLLWSLYVTEESTYQDTKNTLILLASITGHTAFILLMVSVIKDYYREPVGTETIMDESISTLPSFTLCLTNSSDGINSIWNYNGSSSMYICTSPTECEYVQPLSVYDILEYQQKIDTSPVPDSMQTCSIFGYPCTAPEGPMHTWKKLAGVNAHCYQLHIDTKSLTKPVRRKMVIEMNAAFSLFAHDSDGAVSEYSTPENGMIIPFQQHHEYLLKPTDYKRFNNSQHSCCQRVSYSASQCLSRCAQKAMSDFMNCTLPWIESDLTNLDLCFDPRDYLQQENYTEMLDAKFFSKCRCPVSCHTMDIIIDQFRVTDATTAGVTVLFDPITVIRRQFWLYPVSIIVINLGGGAGLLTGISLLSILVQLDRLYCYLFSNP